MFPTPEILLHLNAIAEEALRGGPALPVAIGFALALLEAVILPRRLWGKALAVLVVVLCGAGAAALLRHEQHTSRAIVASQAAGRVAAETSALHGVWVQLDGLARTLPSPTKATPEKFDTVDNAAASLNAKVASLTEQVTALKTGSVGRSIDPANATKLADDLRQYGSYRAVVSCVTGDDEAYSYANQLVGILKIAGWDAHGPESTANVVEAPAMGVTVLVRDPSAPDAAKILLAAFDRLNIAHQPGISADDAIPDTATV
ncbi:MAG TPA: hypothetical protein VM782_03015, partial [Stellaceae bacterium]|nr:hypothetical protein [Stellaceae bacterium]